MSARSAKSKRLTAGSVRIRDTQHRLTGMMMQISLNAIAKMRTIKFRAWNGERMDYNLTVNFNNKDINYILNDMQQVFNVMQFTGLKDKNGKEIYSGDIVKIVDVGADGIYAKQYPTLFNGSTGEVNWGDSAWEIDDGDDGYIHMSVRGKYEVIGNIYENPELIKENNV